MVAIKHLLSIQASDEAIYHAISTAEGLAGWWTTEVIAQPVEGSVAEFRFGDRYHNKMIVKRLVPQQRVEWECIQGDAEWLGTNFIFDIEGEAGGCVLKFAHTDWREVTDFYASCN